jgi:hypothetical protein
MRFPCISSGLMAAVLSFAPIHAQQPAAARSVSSTTPMVATDRYLFVLRGDVLWQFNVNTLAVVRSFTFPSAGAPVAGREAAQAPDAPPHVVVRKRPAAKAPSAEAIEASIESALQWLQTHQDDDGKWDCDNFMKHDDPLLGAINDGPGNAVHDVGVTGLALLAFLGGGSTMRGGLYKDSIKKGVKWLREQQQENGLFGTNVSHDFIYNHAIATFAMSEAYGLSNAQLLKATAQKGIDYLESHRNPYAVWRYQPRDNDNDTSVTSWAVCAYCSADSYGLTVNREAMKLASVWFDQVTGDDGRAGYSKQGEPSSRKPGDHSERFPVGGGEAMTAAATMSRFFLGQDPQTKPIMKASADVLASKPPSWEKGNIDAVYWYFGTYAMVQMGGAHWRAWERSLGALVENQRKDGNLVGSWDPVGVWDEDGGRVFVTALYAMALQAGKRVAKIR